jgi:phage-related holin
MSSIQTIDFILNKVTQVFEISTLKITLSILISFGFFLFGNLHTEALVAIVMLLLLDTVLGVTASVHEGNSITSSRFSRAMLKSIVYLTSISAGYYADTTLPFDIIQSTMIAFVGVTEFISILENIGRMGFNTPKRLLFQLKEFQSKK